ncbi:hypothetical protein NE237_028771 [Protea cynaroides]|uniref:ZF-HD dimerization-type domain-containing protein n=1 Tax=Protea cynaroides TaxID=273540 RepID=A0A9Q0GUG8_9MAGN|nr:hypothetical protein NE237_028771 [Protea cynaroides]
MDVDHDHMIHHEPTPPGQSHIIPCSSPQMPSNGRPTTAALEDHMPYKKVVRYRECQKNHAASMGGNARDGCGEFMASGEEGTLEALKCSACNCHRNFHRKEIQGDYSSSCGCYHQSQHLNRLGFGRKLILGPTQHKGAEALEQYYHGGALIHPTPSRAAYEPSSHSHQMIMSSYNLAGGSLLSESEEQEEGGDGGGFLPRSVPQLANKKRYRTKFTQQQKEKMLSFADKVGWRMQKQEEAVVQQFCQDIGIRRRVLKVWMHNNKHNFAN